MLDISPTKIGHVIVRARECDAKVAAWEDPTSKTYEADSDSILEDLSSDGTRSELAAFIGGLNEDEQVALVAVTWIGRGTFSPEELDEALDTAKAERVAPTERYLMGIPLLADYLEEGLDKLGYSVEDAESDFL